MRKKYIYINRKLVVTLKRFIAWVFDVSNQWNSKRHGGGNLSKGGERFRTFAYDALNDNVATALAKSERATDIGLSGAR